MRRATQHEIGSSQYDPAHIPALDGLRGLAILAVFSGHHGGGRQFHSPFLRFVGGVLSAGWFGVDLFFVLSGFLITGILLRSAADPHYYRKFYARRSLRIFPIYYLVLLGLVVFAPILRIHWHGSQLSYFAYFQNFVLVFRDRNLAAFGPFVVLGPYWSLAIEEQFYLVWPACIRLCRRRRNLGMLFALSIAVPFLLRFFLPAAATHNLTCTRFDELAVGGLLAWIFASGWHRRVHPGVPPVLLALALSLFLVVIALGGTDSQEGWLMQRAGYLLLALCSALLIWMTFISRWAAAIFSAGWLRFFGRYSYGIYIYHGLFVAWERENLYPRLEHFLHSPVLGAAAYFFANLALYTGIAFASYHLVEKRFLRLKVRFSYAGEATASRTPADLVAAAT